MRNFRDFFKDNKPTVGLFINFMCPELVEIAAYTGFDFAIMDNEHGAWDGATFAHMIRACDAAGILPVVRTSQIDETEIKKALDSGASAVMVPGISTPEQAAECVALSHFAPRGVRGACPYVRANKFNAGDKRQYFDWADETISIIPLVEGAEGVRNFEAICEVEGIDNVFFGPCDLANSLGHAGDEFHPDVQNAIKQMIAQAKKHNVHTGMLAFDGKDAKRVLDAGCDYVAAMSDVGLFLEICQKTIQEAKGLR